jgi:hypothetical protein
VVGDRPGQGGMLPVFGGTKAVYRKTLGGHFQNVVAYRGDYKSQDLKGLTGSAMRLYCFDNPTQREIT